MSDLHSNASSPPSTPAAPAAPAPSAASAPSAAPAAPAGPACAASAASPATASRRPPWGLFVAVLVLIGVLALPTPADLPLAGHRMLAILAFAVVVWISEAVSYETSAIMITSLMAALIGLAPTIGDPNTLYGTSRALGMALAGFANTALALVAAALFISAAMTVTGLDRRIALVTLSAIGTSTRRILVGTIAVTIALSLVVPSATARSACVVPIMMGVIAAFGVDKRSNIAAGIMITVAQATSIWNVGIQTAAAQNLLAVGFMDKLLGERVTWLQWLIAGAPWALAMSVVLYLLVRWLLPPETEAIPGGKEAVQRELAGLGPMSGPQKRLAAVSIGLLLAWATEGKLHGFDTATVTFVGLVILMLPRVGVMDWKTMQQRTPWGTLIVFGVGISLGTALLTTQAGQWLGKFVVANSGLATQGPIAVFAILAAFLIVIHLGFASATALTAAMLPILISVLQTLPGDIDKVGITMLLGFTMSFGFILPINAPQNMVCLGTDTFNGRQFARIGIPVTLVGYAMMLLFAATYWRWLGWI